MSQTSISSQDFEYPDPELLHGGNSAYPLLDHRLYQLSSSYHQSIHDNLLSSYQHQTELSFPTDETEMDPEDDHRMDDAVESPERGIQRAPNTGQANTRLVGNANALTTQAENPSCGRQLVAELKLLPRLREVEIKPGKGFSLIRISNQVAALGYTRGQLAHRPCTYCEVRNGPFPQCVIVPGELKGTCTNCYYGNNSSACSFRSMF